MTSASCLNGSSTIDLEFPATTVRVTAAVKQRVGRASKHLLESVFQLCQPAVIPPSWANTWPVRYLDAALAK